MAEVSRIQKLIGSSIVHADEPSSFGVETETVVSTDERTTAPSEDLGVAIARSSGSSLRSPSLNPDPTNRPRPSSVQQRAEDKDQVASRESIVGASDGIIDQVTEHPTALGKMNLQTAVGSVKKSNKWRRAANPIDDLFEGLE